ncbi:hypothetical protein J4410_06640, partial [Candidatus Woesearchaeota archaeon]|nr:hypothetical protein [Candidatus Woesearchaeota archaeon]
KVDNKRKKIKGVLVIVHKPSYARRRNDRSKIEFLDLRRRKKGRNLGKVSDQKYGGKKPPKS